MAFIAILNASAHARLLLHHANVPLHTRQATAPRQPHVHIACAGERTNT